MKGEFSAFHQSCFGETTDTHVNVDIHLVVPHFPSWRLRGETPAWFSLSMAELHFGCSSESS